MPGAAASKSKNKTLDTDDAPASLVDTETGEIIEPGEKKAPKLPYGVSLVSGATCPDCGASVVAMRKDGKAFHVCMKQMAVEPDCYWYEEVRKTE